MKFQANPIIIVGSGRSGTSVLTWCLGQHPNILPLPEANWIARLSVHMRHLYRLGSANGRFNHLGALDWDEDDFFAEFGRYVDQFIISTREPRLRLIRKMSLRKAGMTEEKIAELEAKGKLSPDPGLVSAANYQIVRAKSDPKSRWVDGAPENTFYMYSLSRVFPGAKFIHLLRDPDAVARSFMKFSNAGEAGIDHSESEAYGHWHRYVEYAFNGEQALGKDKVFRLRYEDLIANSEISMRQCFEFLGEDYHPNSLLPLKEKINSSGSAESEIMVGNSMNATQARKLYERVLTTVPAEPDREVLAQLEKHYIDYADALEKR